MKKFLAIIFTIALAYVTSYYTSDTKKDLIPGLSGTEFDFQELLYALNLEVDTTDPRALMRRGTDRYWDYYYQEALDDFDRVIRLDSNYSEAYYYKSLCYEALGDTAKAVPCYYFLIEFSPNDYSTLTKLGNWYRSQNQVDSAAKYLRKAVEYSDYDTEAHQYLAELLIKKDSLEKALEVLNRGIDMDSEIPELYELRRKIYIEKGMTAKALQDYMTIMTIDPAYFPDYIQQAEEAKEKDSWNEALKYYKQALAQKNGSKDIKYEVAWAFFKTGQPDSALNLLNELIKQNPENTTYRFKKAYILGEMGRDDSAIKAYNEVIELNKNDNVAYNNRGYQYFKKKEYDKALADYNKAIELSPDYYLSYLNRGILYFTIEQYFFCISDMKKVESMKPENIWAFYYMGKSLEKLERFSSAKPYFEKFLQSADPALDEYQEIKNRLNNLN